MSAPFEILPRAFICKWLYKMIDRHGARKRREGCTLPALARYLDIPLESLRQWALRDTHFGMSQDRQRLLSKVIAMVENGQLEFEYVRKGSIETKVGVIRDKPKPICRYRVEFGSGRPVVKLVARPKAFSAPPSFKSLALNLTSEK